MAAAGGATCDELLLCMLRLSLCSPAVLYYSADPCYYIIQLFQVYIRISFAAIIFETMDPQTRRTAPRGVCVAFVLLFRFLPVLLVYILGKSALPWSVFAFDLQKSAKRSLASSRE